MPESSSWHHMKRLGRSGLQHVGCYDKDKSLLVSTGYEKARPSVCDLGNELDYRYGHLKVRITSRRIRIRNEMHLAVSPLLSWYIPIAHSC